MANFKTGLNRSGLVEGKPVKVEKKGGILSKGRSILVVMVGGDVYAIDSVCSHRGGPLDQGKMEGYEVTCPWHGAVYDVRSGKASPSSTLGKMQSRFAVKVDAAGDIWVDA